MYTGVTVHFLVFNLVLKWPPSRCLVYNWVNYTILQDYDKVKKLAMGLIKTRPLVWCENTIDDS